MVINNLMSLFISGIIWWGGRTLEICLFLSFDRITSVIHEMAAEKCSFKFIIHREVVVSALERVNRLTFVIWFFLNIE